MDEMKEIMDETQESTNEAVGETKEQEAIPEGICLEDMDEETLRDELEDARDAETRAYQGLNRATTLTARQKGVLALAELEKVEHPTKAQLEEKCRLILESYYLPRAATDGFVVVLDPEFTHFEDPDRDYIEAHFSHPSGKKLSIGYNYKVAEDGKSILVFEKTFQNVVLKPGDPEKYVVYGRDGETEIVSLSTEELEEKIEDEEVVEVEEGFFLKAKDEDGLVRNGVTTQIVEDEGIPNVRISFGENEQRKYSLGKNGQLTCAITNDVITSTVETRKFASAGPIYDSPDVARAAADKEVMADESNANIHITKEGTTIADFKYIPAYRTSVEVTGLSRRLGRGIEGYDPEESDEENLRRQFAKLIEVYLDEKGYHVMNITCENLTADVTENVGFMNTIKTYHLTGGTVSVTYVKRFKSVVSIKQGFLGRSQTNDPAVILSQLPEGSELLNPQDIDWKNSKPEVAYITRSSIQGVGSAQTENEADEKAAENAVYEAQKQIARNLNGGIASGIREAIAGSGAVSTVANPLARLDTVVVSKEDMELTHKDPKFAYSGTCDKTVSTTENKLVAVTSWSGNLLTYVEPTEPVIDKGIPTDDNYEKYINEGDESSILLFEASDKGLRRYMGDVVDAQSQANIYRDIYLKARANLDEVERIFYRRMDEKLGVGDEKKAEEAAVEEVAVAEEVPVVEEAVAVEETPVVEEAPAVEEAVAVEETPVVEEASVVEEVAGEEEVPVTEETLEVEAAPVVDHAEAAAMLEAIFAGGTIDVPAKETVIEEPSVITEETEEEPEADGMSAKEALLAIFGDES